MNFFLFFTVNLIDSCAVISIVYVIQESKEEMDEYKNVGGRELRILSNAWIHVC